MSCRPLTGLQGDQALEASGGSTGSGPHPKGDSADKTGVVYQGSRELGSATCRGLGGMQGGQELWALGGSAGSGSQPWETPWKRPERSARAPAGWPLRPAGASSCCTGPHPSSGETQRKRKTLRRSAGEWEY